jgi:hypothetical protein
MPAGAVVRAGEERCDAAGKFQFGQEVGSATIPTSLPMLSMNGTASMR